MLQKSDDTCHDQWMGMLLDVSLDCLHGNGEVLLDGMFGDAHILSDFLVTFSFEFAAGEYRLLLGGERSDGLLQQFVLRLQDEVVFVIGLGCERELPHGEHFPDHPLAVIYRQVVTDDEQQSTDGLAGLQRMALFLEFDEDILQQIGCNGPILGETEDIAVNRLVVLPIDRIECLDISLF